MAVVTGAGGGGYYTLHMVDIMWRGAIYIIMNTRTLQGKGGYDV